MEPKTKPRKKGFNLFDDDDDDIEEAAAAAPTTTTAASSKHMTPPKFGYQAYQQLCASATPSDDNDKMLGFAAATTSKFGQQTQLPAHTVIPSSNKTDSFGKTTITSENGQPVFGFHPTATTTMTTSANKDFTTSCFGQQMASFGQKREPSSCARAAVSSELGFALMALPQKDFAFYVNSVIIPVHKIILAAQSPFFYQQFYENPCDTFDYENADDFDKEAVEFAIKACYDQSFDETTLDERIAEQLLKFADIFGMSCVKDLLPKTIAKYITEENICSSAVRSYDTGDVELRRKCVEFVAALILQNKQIPPGIEKLPADFAKEIVLAIASKAKKQ